MSALCAAGRAAAVTFATPSAFQYLFFRMMYNLGL
jgi:hypothetical protein